MPDAPAQDKRASLFSLALSILTDPRLLASVGSGARTYIVAGALVLSGIARIGGYDAAAPLATTPTPTFEDPAPAQPAAPSTGDSLTLLLNGLGLATLRHAIGRKDDEPKS